MYKYFLVVVFVMVLASCATAPEYTYSPPETAEGRACVARCQETQNACRNSQANLYSQAKSQCESQSAYKYNQCEREAQVEQNACLRFARTDLDRASCIRKICIKDGCYMRIDYSFCDNEFRVCYQNCGGKVGVMK